MRPSFRYEPAKKNTVKSTSATRALPLFVALITAGLISTPAPQANAQTSKARSAAAKEKALTRQERESARVVQANDSAIGASPSDTPTLPARQWKVSLKELGVGRPVSLRGVESEASDIVALQAQYGITETIDPTATTTTAAAYLNRVDRWVDATGTFGPTMALMDRNRIRAIRIAVIARDGNLQRNTVSQACNGAAAGVSRVCIWQADANPASVDLSSVPNWQRYRYRSFEATIPLRNIIWNRDAL